MVDNLHQSSQVDYLFVCNLCPVTNMRTFNSERGLNIHKCYKDRIVNDESVNTSELNLQNIFTPKSKIGVLKRIPKSARPLASKT